jgi:hypothetical protein
MVGAGCSTMSATVYRPDTADAFGPWEMRWDLTPWFTMVRSDPTRWSLQEPQRKAGEGLDNLPAHLTPPGVPPPWRGHFVWGDPQWVSVTVPSIP